MIADTIIHFSQHSPITTLMTNHPILAIQYAMIANPEKLGVILACTPIRTALQQHLQREDATTWIQHWAHTANPVQIAALKKYPEIFTNLLLSEHNNYLLGELCVSTQNTIRLIQFKELRACISGLELINMMQDTNIRVSEFKSIIQHPDLREKLLNTSGAFNQFLRSHVSAEQLDVLMQFQDLEPAIAHADLLNVTIQRLLSLNGQKASFPDKKLLRQQEQKAIANTLLQWNPIRRALNRRERVMLHTFINPKQSNYIRIGVSSFITLTITYTVLLTLNSTVGLLGLTALIPSATFSAYCATNTPYTKQHIPTSVRHLLFALCILSCVGVAGVTTALLSVGTPVYLDKIPQFASIALLTISVVTLLMCLISQRIWSTCPMYPLSKNKLQLHNVPYAPSPCIPPFQRNKKIMHTNFTETETVKTSTHSPLVNRT